MFGSSDSVKIFSEDFKQSDKMAFLFVWVGSPRRWWSRLFGPLWLDIIHQKSLRQILFLQTSEFQEVVDWIILFWFTGSVHSRQNRIARQFPRIARQSQIFLHIPHSGKDQVTMDMTPFY